MTRINSDVNEAMDAPPLEACAIMSESRRYLATLRDASQHAASAGDDAEAPNTPLPPTFSEEQLTTAALLNSDGDINFSVDAILCDTVFWSRIDLLANARHVLIDLPLDESTKRVVTATFTTGRIEDETRAVEPSVPNLESPSALIAMLARWLDRYNQASLRTGSSRSPLKGIQALVASTVSIVPLTVGTDSNARHWRTLRCGLDHSFDGSSRVSAPHASYRAVSQRPRNDTAGTRIANWKCRSLFLLLCSYRLARGHEHRPLLLERIGG